MGKEYQMRKGLKIESYDLNLKREGTPQRILVKGKNTDNMTAESSVSWVDLLRIIAKRTDSPQL